VSILLTFIPASVILIKMVQKELEQFTDWLDSDLDVLTSLADTFKVSTTAMGYRLQNLGYYRA
jgi:ABC-type sulfate transport system permease component